MKFLRLAAPAPLLLLGLVVSIPVHADPAGPPYTLKMAAGPGDAAVEDSTFQLNFTVSTPDGKPLAKTATDQLEHYTETVLATAGDQPIALRRVYGDDYDRETGGPPAKTTTDDSLSNKIVVLRDNHGTISVELKNGKISDHARDSFKNAFDNSSRDIYPDHPVAPGDSWNAHPDSVKKYFSAASASLTGTFVDVEQAHGYRCARLHFVLKLLMTTPGVPANMTMTVQGDLLHAIEPQRPLSVKLIGTVVVEGKGQIEGVDVVCSGSGAMALTEKALKIAGVPVVR